MPVIEAHSVTLTVPDLDAGRRFYSAAGLEEVSLPGGVAFRCPGQHVAINLIAGDTKRLHHIALRAEGLAEIEGRVPKAEGQVVDAPSGFEQCTGCWVRDPHGLLIHLIDAPGGQALPTAAPFEINAPGHLVRRNRSAIKPINASAPVHPLRLGHVMLFSPEPLRSVAFLVDAFGMGLSDHAQGIVAFSCAARNSDHHVVAFARSSGLGFHHASFQVADPDEVGRGGRALVNKFECGEWGFGRHTIGSNFFHYIQDPWGSWIEYFSDIDHIEDYSLWTPTNYGLEDSLANWGPAVPHDFIHNYELGASFSPSGKAQNAHLEV